MLERHSVGKGERPLMSGKPIHGHAPMVGGVLRTSPTYNTWRGMKQRCANENSSLWENYGGRGISFDPSWDSFENFLLDMGVRPYGMTLDRINSDGHYFKENCRWATTKQQAMNKRNTLSVTYLSETKPLLDWCDELGLPYKTAWRRLFNLGYTPERAFTQPVQVRHAKATT